MLFKVLSSQHEEGAARQKAAREAGRDEAVREEAERDDAVREEAEWDEAVREEAPGAETAGAKPASPSGQRVGKQHALQTLKVNLKEVESRVEDAAQQGVAEEWQHAAFGWWDGNGAGQPGEKAGEGETEAEAVVPLLGEAARLQGTQAAEPAVQGEAREDCTSEGEDGGTKAMMIRVRLSSC